MFVDGHARRVARYASLPPSNLASVQSFAAALLAVGLGATGRLANLAEAPSVRLTVSQAGTSLAGAVVARRHLKPRSTPYLSFPLRFLASLLPLSVLIGLPDRSANGQYQPVTETPTGCCSLATYDNGITYYTGINQTTAPVSVVVQNPSPLDNGATNLVTLVATINNYPNFIFYTNGQNNTIAFSGHGQVDQGYGEPASYVNGPWMYVTNYGNLYLYAPPTSAFNSAALSVYSGGANGATSGKVVNSYNAGAGQGAYVVNYGAITVNGYDTNPSTTGSPWTPYATGIWAGSAGGEGTSARFSDTIVAGNGGNGGPVNVTTVTGSTITLTGGGNANGVTINGINAISQGTIQGQYVDTEYNNYGIPGSGWSVVVADSGAISGTATQAIGIVAASIGAPGNYQTGGGIAKVNGQSGEGGQVSVNLGSTGSIQLTSGSAIGILAASSYGAYPNGAGKGGMQELYWANPSCNVTTSGQPCVSVSLDAGSSIVIGSPQAVSSGRLAIGVAAVSTGAISVLEPFATANLNNGAYGESGSVEVDNSGSITTYGHTSAGIVALSIGGMGALTQAGSGVSTLGTTSNLNGAVSGAAVTVNNYGTIVTDGASAAGIIALSTGAGGVLSAESNATYSNWTTYTGATNAGLRIGSGLLSGVVLGSNNGTNDGANNGGSVTVQNSGTITTGDGQGGGKAAIGIVAQSIGGGGGLTGGNGVAALIGDAGGSGGNGGPVTVTNSGSVTTYDNGAIGILAQSIGGGGGDGGNAAGVFVAVGGSGGNGGSGNAVTVDLTGGTVTTAGSFAAGVIAQSVGGGGGNGGYGTAAGVFVSTAIGGTGGSGGAGGAIDVTNNATLQTAGQDSIGIIVQSVAGGGGNGGAATSVAAGVGFTVNLSIGGAAGNGQSGGDVTINNTGQIITAGPDSIALIAQAVGGGGGTGGASVAQTLSVSIPDVPSFSFTASVGGSGGKGGNGGTVTLTNTGTITTNGEGGLGILAQSIGGGGGNGGDSTAASHALAVGAPDVNLTIALGATGGSGGSGGPVGVYEGVFSSAQLTLGPVSMTLPASAVGSCNATCGATTISTGGANAPAIEAQSIGGGGGNSTAGNASNGSFNLGASGGDTYQMNVGLGASGGAGGAGGTVNVATGATTTLVTTGSGSPGILAQSISGGGGTSSGGSFGLNVGSYTVKIAAGGAGVTGAGSGVVSVANGGTIKTSGGDSIGILAQSIGGGGGDAGSSDASSAISSSNQAENSLNPPKDPTYTATLALGGPGGAGGNGGQVSIANTGSISTRGERAYGIEAQSIGGGGGNAGSANAGAAGTDQTTYAASIAAGGTGGEGGGGNNVAVYSAGPISTAGYNAYGILAQSIGGGGGVGADGSVNSTTTISLGAGINGSGGATGGGAAVTITTAAGGTITTIGDDASAILAQSIGGGGGTGSAGCGGVNCLSAEGINSALYPQSFSYNLNVGGNAGASGSGYETQIEVGDAIRTFGARSMGIVAQSIGGGGGFSTAAAANLSSTLLAASPGTNNGTGGPIVLTLDSTGSITTSGAGAWGILAQSVGGGGGFAGDPSLPLAIPVSNTLPRSGTGDAAGGAISVTVNGNIITAGENAHGIFAQSIGGSGGLVGGGGNSPIAYLIAGNTAQIRDTSNATYWGDGGRITIAQGASSVIETSGSGSIAIVAQSSGNTAAAYAITVTIGGMVIGGTNSGVTEGVGAAGILLSGGGALTSNANTVTVASSGSVTTMDGIAGTAVLASSGYTNVTNSGVITGSINLGATPGTITNYGTLNTGPVMVSNLLTNAGSLAIGGPGSIATTTVWGDFVQTTSGTLLIDINSTAAQKADLLAVSGSAQIAGRIVPTSTALLPGTITVVTAGNLSSTATVADPLAFRWNLSADGVSVSLSPTPNFTPQGVALSSSESALAAYLTRAWNNSDALFAKTFGYLSQIQTSQQYGATLSAETARATQMEPHYLANLGFSLLGTPLSCPVFVDQGVLLGEDSCAWARLTGQWDNQWARDGDPGYAVSGTTYRIGGQTAIAPGWFLGGTLATGNSWASEAGGSTSTGQTFDGSVAIKHTIGHWLFAGSFAVATGSFHNDRLVSLAPAGTLPVASALLQSDSNMYLAGGRVRAAYDFTFGDLYFRPYADFDVIYAGTPGFQESGAAGYALNVHDTSKTTVAISPELEFGGRYNTDQNTILRPFVAIGVNFIPNNTRTVDANFVGASAYDGSFTTYMKSPNVLGNLDVGFQLYREGGFEVRTEYTLHAGSGFLSQSASGRIAYHF